MNDVSLDIRQANQSPSGRIRRGKSTLLALLAGSIADIRLRPPALFDGTDEDGRASARRAR